MKLCEAIGLRVKELLKEKKMTQYALFIKSGVPQTTISAVIRCLHENPGATVLWNIAEGLEVTMSEFYDSPLFDSENITD